jgi:hypothetical protein
MEASGLTAALASEVNDTSLLRALAAANIPAEPQALGKSIASAGAVATALRTAEWKVLNQLTARSESEWTRVLDTLQSAASADELHSPLAPAISAAKEAALNILMRQAPEPPPTSPSPKGKEPVPPPAPEPVPDPPTGRTEQPKQSSNEGDQNSERVPGRTLGELNAVDLVLNDLELDLGEFGSQLKLAVAQNPGKTLHLKWWLE